MASAPGSALEEQIRVIGRDLHAALPSQSRHPVRALDGKAMELASRDAELRAALFRLVDVTPACRSLDDLARHLTGYLRELEDPPQTVDAAIRAARTAPGRRALGGAAAAGVRHMAHRFIVGESPQAALETLGRLWRAGAACSVDLLGEATVTPPEADRYAARCMEALDTLAAAAPAWPASPALETDSIGPLPRVNLSVKVSALTPLMRPEAPDVGRGDAAVRLRPLLRRAKQLDAHLHKELTRRLLDARPAVRVAVASHNLRSVAHAIAHNRMTGGDDGDLELQILRGLGDDLQHALAERGLRVRAYCPVGDLVAGMSYLVRRLLENTSNDSFLGELGRGAPIEELLTAP